MGSLMSHRGCQRVDTLDEERQPCSANLGRCCHDDLFQSVRAGSDPSAGDRFDQHQTGRGPCHAVGYAPEAARLRLAVDLSRSEERQ